MIFIVLEEVLTLVVAQTKMKKHSTKHQTQSKGFTLIELILYVSISSIFMLASFNFAWDVIYGRQKAHAQQITDQAVKLATYKISYFLKQATDLQIINPSEIQITRPDGLVTIKLTDQKIIVNQNSTDYFLTPNTVNITDLEFTDLSSPDSASKNIAYSITAENSTNNLSSNFYSSQSIQTSIELSSQFNQARGLLIDLTNLTLSNNLQQVQGVTLTNTASQDIEIDQINISWSGTVGGESFTAIQIDSGAEEWSGSQPSGSTIDINNYILNSGTTVNLDYLNFSNNVNGGTFTVSLIMSDGSTSKAYFTIYTTTPSPTPTISPTPSPSPSPATSCPNICTSLGYSTGTCRANANQCSQNNETYQSSGDIYCSGGGSSTCCCAGSVSPSPSPTINPSPSPTISPSPSPTLTCPSYCISLGYSTGSCEKNAAQCNKNGQIYQSGGNIYCTGGSTADTCCCTN